MLAGDTLPDVFTIPFTDGKSLIEQGQLADITDLVKALPYADQVQPQRARHRPGRDGHIFGVPRQGYGIGLQYNRDLFTQAGLDPDKPPTTWDEVRAAAKAIAEKTGQAGYAQMSQSNTGGWQTTVATYARGGRMEQLNEDGSVTSTVNNPATKAALEFLKALRWEDDSMGANFLFDWGSINQAFAAGQIGMYTQGADVYTYLVQAHQIDPDIYGLTTVPLTRRPERGRAHRWRHRRCQRQGDARAAGGSRQVDRLLLHAEAARPGRRGAATRRRSLPTASRSAPRRCPSSTRPPWSSPRSGSRTTSTCRSTR